MDFHQSSVKVSSWILIFDFTIVCKQTLHHRTAVEFGANFQTCPLLFKKTPYYPPQHPQLVKVWGILLQVCQRKLCLVSTSVQYFRSDVKRFFWIS